MQKPSIESSDKSLPLSQSISVDNLINFEMFSELDICAIDSNAILFSELIFMDNMEGYPPNYREVKSKNIIDRCDIWIDGDNYIIVIWKTSRINERMSQMSFNKLEKNKLVWSVGEKSFYDLTSENETQEIGDPTVVHTNDNKAEEQTINLVVDDNPNIISG